MRFLLILHATLVAIGYGLVLVAVGPQEANSLAFGGLVSFANLALLVFAWPRILAKKQVALSIGVIVFKFAILGWILYVAVHSEQTRIGWFAIGLGFVILSSVVTALGPSGK